ncbi:hypothetical protein [Phyllobacterium sp. OV277]|nr:hypothetical protein [Phyllobacterium sp. OV277]
MTIALRVWAATARPNVTGKPAIIIATGAVTTARNRVKSIKEIVLSQKV